MADAHLLPIVLALSAASLFGISNLVARFGLRHADALTGSLVSIGSTAAFYWVLFPFFLREADWTADRLLVFLAVFALIGLFTPSISQFLAFEGNRRLGPTISGTVAATAPLFAASSAVLVLGEQPTLNVGLGTLGIVAGVMVLSWRGRGVRDWRYWALLFPLGAAILRGIVHMAAKIGFAEAAAPFTAALVTFTVSLLVVLLAHRLSGRSLARAAPRGGLRWFVVTGVLNGTALGILYAALSLGQVIVVSPVISTYPLFTFVLSLMFGIERLGPRIFVGVVMVVGGAIAVAIS